jgi:hypothetical protein
MAITQDTIWISNIDLDNIHGHKVGALNSEHLANIVHFLRTNDERVHGHCDTERLEIILAMLDEAERRELTDEFLSGAPYPYDKDLPYQEYQGGVDA